MKRNNGLIEPHSDLLEKHGNDTTLYKIVSLENFIDMFKNNYLYFKRVDTYEDDKNDSDQPKSDKKASKETTFLNAPNFTIEEYYQQARSRTCRPPHGKYRARRVRR